MRTFIAIGIASILLAIVTASYGFGPIDLDVPGNLEAIARSHPEHFAKIQQILVEVPRRPPNEDSVATWMRTEFEARNIRYTDLIMTSLPPKKRLDFSLDNASYVKIITLTSWRAELNPARETRAK
jgi:hypothetical protein